MDKSHLPNGEHWGLRINSSNTFRTGLMVAGARPKLILHTTEGNGFGLMDQVLREKKAEPHVLIDPGTRDVKQYMPFTDYARALEHPNGTAETNRAGCIQVEIVSFAAPQDGRRDVGEESLAWYANLAACLELIRHRVNFGYTTPLPFKRGARRVPASTFLKATGIYGHMHVPHNSHWDPGAIRIDRLVSMMHQANAHHG